MSFYGIDLGTTNSLICNKASDFLSELVPSCVDITTGEVGISQYDNLNAKRSFKTDMSSGDEGLMPRVASKDVLLELKRIAQRQSVEPVKDVVISVPAYFSDNQRQATIKAATDAGLCVKGLVNEPTAAAIYITRNKKGLYVVFDLGGGTFDVSAIDSRYGMFDVMATDGLKCGGDDFDMNIFKFIVKRSNLTLFRMPKQDQLKLQHECTKYKIRMQKERKPFVVDMSQYGANDVEFTPENYINIMKMTFGECINCMQSLLEQSVCDGEYVEILLVGGSTRCPYLREWIAEVTGITPAPLTYNPDQVVAQGAAYYAEMLEQGVINTKVSDVTKRLSIKLVDGTTKTIINSNSKIPLRATEMFYSPVASKSLVVTLLQGDGLNASDNETIGQLVWDYENPVPAGEGEVLVEITIDEAGVITFSVNELLKPPIKTVLRRNMG